MRRRSRSLLWIAPLGAFGCGADRGPAAPADAPCILLVTVDTLRADALGSYGNGGGLTPYLDALAAEGVLFERATAPMATTLPSHASMLTGLHPRSHGVRANSERLTEDAATLAERLAASGWDTAAFASVAFLLHQGNLDQGFDAVSPKELPGDVAGARSGEVTVELARKWLQRERARPFFLWVHLFEPHVPLPVRPWAQERLAGYGGPFADGCQAAELVEFNQSLRWKDGRYGPADAEAYRQIYHAAVREADALVGRMVGAARSAAGDRGLTLVFAADHGEMTGEHGLLGHGSLLWEGVLHVPLFVHDPRRWPARRVEQRVGLVDLAPTLLEAVGLPPLPAAEGRSLLPLLRGETLAETGYFAEVRIGSQERVMEQVAAYEDRFKMVRDRKGVRCYDLREDPGELAPAPPPPELARAVARLEAFRAGGVRAAASEGGGSEDAALRAQLAELGYAE